ncbi:hypothetical protein GDO81_022818 [Engystomops pustulosus]|uniref:Uncharacterized protein n=1 Tax=Engystomops pustulosus TaxID=76066 RepID=A0AAV6YMA1_ENGPU|nr:hypothetical protein GDO81_022818 [Engystomops pustulosus]
MSRSKDGKENGGDGNKSTTRRRLMMEGLTQEAPTINVIKRKSSVIQIIHITTISSVCDIPPPGPSEVSTRSVRMRIHNPRDVHQE